MNFASFLTNGTDIPNENFYSFSEDLRKMQSLKIYPDGCTNLFNFDDFLKKINKQIIVIFTDGEINFSQNCLITEEKQA